MVGQDVSGKCRSILGNDRSYGRVDHGKWKSSIHEKGF